MSRSVLRLLAAALTLIAAPGAAQQVASSTIQGVIRAESTGDPVPDAEVRVAGTTLTARSDSLGRFTLAGLTTGRLRLTVTATGYRPFHLSARVSESVLQLEIVLPVSIQRLPGLDVRSRADATSDEEYARALFERHVLPSVSTVSRAEIASMPTPVAPDIMRSLQALPGMMNINDLDAQLYVRGGSADQNLFLLDGAPVFGAHHAFGMSGVFNPEAIDRVDFYRGARPARFGGALTSVTELEQRHDPPDGSRNQAGLSFFDAHALHAGRFMNDRGGYMIAARRTFTDAGLEDRFPLTFHDVHGKTTVEAGGHALSLSAFTSSDRFNLFFGGGDGELWSRWENHLGSLRWSAPAWRGWTTSTTVWMSGYDGHMRIGEADSATVTENRVRASGAKFHVTRGVLGARLTAGAEVEHDDIRLLGTETEGSYFAGRVHGTATRPSAFVEVERMVGGVRLAPGLRITARPGEAVLAEPRIGVRIPVSEVASLTIAASRDHQFLSGLRDERTAVPGPPFWFLHPSGAPTSRSDALSAEANAWWGAGWNASLAAYARHVSDAPHWRPEGVRDLSSVSYDDGRARGVELSVRRYGTRATGWLAYALSHAQFSDARTGTPYDAPSDRRHSITAIGSFQTIAGITLSARSTYGTGVPFWPFVGRYDTPRFVPFPHTSSGSFMGRRVPAWSDRQLRMPAYFRSDVSVRRSFIVRGAIVRPYLTIQNITSRSNVLTYEPRIRRDIVEGQELLGTKLLLRPTALPFTIFPTIGVEIQF